MICCYCIPAAGQSVIVYTSVQSMAIPFACRVGEGHFVLDVMHDPGSLYPVNSKKADKYKRLGNIGGPPAGPGLESVQAGDGAGLSGNNNNLALYQLE